MTKSEVRRIVRAAQAVCGGCEGDSSSEFMDVPRESLRELDLALKGLPTDRPRPDDVCECGHLFVWHKWRGTNVAGCNFPLTPSDRCDCVQYLQQPPPNDTLVRAFRELQMGKMPGPLEPAFSDLGLRLRDAVYFACNKTTPAEVLAALREAVKDG